ncbi:MAG: hypothetical protein AAGA67_00555 [Cyanobacteria bacterium P01_F01_bin.153]
MAVVLIVVVLALLSVLNVVFNVIFVFIPDALFHLLLPFWQWLAIALVATALAWGLAKS